MPRLTIVTRDGTEKTVEGRTGWSVMENIRDNGFDELLALCGGCCSCATCHVHVDAECQAAVGPANADEDDLLDTSDHRTPASQAEQYYTALQVRGIPTAFVKVPGAGHGITARPSQSAAKASAILAWFDRYKAPAAQ